MQVVMTQPVIVLICVLLSFLTTMNNKHLGPTYNQEQNVTGETSGEGQGLWQIMRLVVVLLWSFVLLAG
jgi:hypothetical protein